MEECRTTTQQQKRHSATTDQSDVSVTDDNSRQVNQSKSDSGLSDINQSVLYIKQQITQLTSLLDSHLIPKEYGEAWVGTQSLNANFAHLNNIKAMKRKFLQNMDKDKIMKIKELLKGKRGKRKKQELKSLIADCGISEVQLRTLALESHLLRRGPVIRDRDLRKSYKAKTHERQQKLLEMAEMMKRNQQSDAGMPVVSKVGNKKVTLHKSSVSIVSHQTQVLTPETIDDAAEALSGRKRRQKMVDKMSVDPKPDQLHKRQNVKRKMKQIVAKLLRDINEYGYRVTFTSTIGSDAGSHSAELTILPILVDEIFPEVKDDGKPEMSEEEYAKHLEREQLMEKQKANEEKMKEMEIRLTHLLTGVEEIIIPTRKRYGPGETKPTDAERMKQYRRKLKEDPDKYQEYKEKRSMRTKKRRLSLLATKMKEKASAAAAAAAVAAAATVAPNPVDEEAHVTQNMAALAAHPQPVGTVNMHMPQVYGHPPPPHQPTVSAVSVHHAPRGQYVGHVGGPIPTHPTHQHPPPMPYPNEMDIVELIAASHNVQNQHFG